MHRYLIALGSNQRHPRYGAPHQILVAAIEALDMSVLARSVVRHSRPIGPSLRIYANAAVLVETKMAPPDLLDHIKALEASFGRRTHGQRWQARVLDLDIILWTGGLWASQDLAIPHVEFRNRAFVLAPMVDCAPTWRDPISGFTLKHLKARVDRRVPVVKGNRPW